MFRTLGSRACAIMRPCARAFVRLTHSGGGNPQKKNYFWGAAGSVVAGAVAGTVVYSAFQNSAKAEAKMLQGASGKEPKYRMISLDELRGEHEGRCVSVLGLLGHVYRFSVCDILVHVKCACICKRSFCARAIVHACKHGAA